MRTPTDKSTITGYPSVDCRAYFVDSETLECNIRLKQIKHLEHTLATYVEKHVQRLDRTLAICNMKTLAATEYWNS